MISNVSGPIPTHEVYFDPQYLSRQHKLRSSFDNLDILQWQSKAPSVQSSRPGTASVIPSKNHIRENIRRVRDFQRFGASRHLYRPTQLVKASASPRPSTAGSKASQCTQKKKAKKQDAESLNGAGLGDQGTLNGDDPSSDYSVDPHFTPGGGTSTVPDALIQSRSIQCTLQEQNNKMSQGVQANPGEMTHFSVSPMQQPPPPEPVNEQRASVPSRVRAASAGPTKREFLRAHAKTAQDEWNLQMLGNVPIPKHVWTPRPEQLTVPSASSAKTVQLIRRNINYVRANAHLAGAAPKLTTRTSFTGNESTSGTKTGQSSPWIPAANSGEPAMWPERRLPVGGLPPYLIKQRYNAAVAAAQAEANQPDPDQPPGHQRMPEADRVSTLELLRKAHAELTDEWSKLPVRMDTMRIRARRSELEERLNELEQAISIFDKPKVFIKPE